jgi:hypothetical protein
MVEQALMGIKTAEGKQNFKSCRHFLNFKLSSPSGILPTLSALHAICRFRLQFAVKGIWLPFAMVLKAISDPFGKLQEGIRLPDAMLFYFRRIFGFCMR